MLRRHVPAMVAGRGHKPRRKRQRSEREPRSLIINQFEQAELLFRERRGYRGRLYPRIPEPVDSHRDRSDHSDHDYDRRGADDTPAVPVWTWKRNYLGCALRIMRRLPAACR
jgi:hypothetical protein